MYQLFAGDINMNGISTTALFVVVVWSHHTFLAITILLNVLIVVVYKSYEQSIQILKEGPLSSMSCSLYYLSAITSTARKYMPQSHGNEKLAYSSFIKHCNTSFSSLVLNSEACFDFSGFCKPLHYSRTGMPSL
jgi:hypothetical protein